MTALRTARAQARANGEYNAQLYRAENPRFTDHKIVSHGDSTQTRSWLKSSRPATIHWEM